MNNIPNIPNIRNIHNIHSLDNMNNRPLIIRSHYGDDSIAMAQWAFEANLKLVEVVTIDTGFAAENWLARQQLGEAHARACGFKTSTIVSPITFAEAVKGRGEFPSTKFQWCSALLKGLPFLDWLDTWDPHCQAIILIAKRKAAAKAHTTIPEWIDKCEFHNDRTVWHPISELETTERDALLARAGFEPLNHRTFECALCVNSTQSDLLRLGGVDIRKMEELEQIIESTLSSSLTESLDLSKIHSKGIIEFIKEVRETAENELKNNNLKNLDETYLDLFYRGCGNHFGCGI